MGKSRKSQLEKFEARMAKKKADEEAIRKARFVASKKTIEERARDIANEFGVTNEDIFAIVARDSMEVFMKLWNNSMENTVKGTLKEDIQPIIREIVREELNSYKEEIREIIHEELVSAYRGIMKGFAEFSTTQETATKEEVKFLPLPKDKEISVMAQQENLNIIAQDKPKRKYNTKRKSLKELTVELMEQGINVLVGNQWVKAGGKYLTAYQSFMKEHKGERGAFKAHISKILSELEENNNINIQ